MKLPILLIIPAAAALAALPARAQEAVAQAPAVQAPASPAAKGELSIIEENDSLFSDSDKHYTQGARASYLSAPLTAGWRYDAFDWLGPLFPGAADMQRRFDWIVLGQSIYTPMNLKLSPPSATDRPYAGWLYSGAELLQENGGNSLTGFEVLLGCDVVVASDRAVFGLPEVKRGLFAAGGGVFISTRIPLAVALELTLTGDPISADRALALGLEDARLHNFLGICYAQTNRMPQAVREHRRAIELDPKLAEAHLNLAYAYQHLGKNSQAREEYATACQLEARFCGATPIPK